MSFLVHSAEEVKAEHIAGHLEKLKKNSYKKESSEAPKVRATLSNFILLSGSVDSSNNDRIEALLSEVSRLHPSRFFVIYYANSAIVPLSCVVKARELKSANGLAMQTEEISLTVNREGLGLIKNLILSHLVPDIETILVSPWSISESNELSDLVTKLLPIVDSYICDAPTTALDKFVSENFHNFQSKFLSWTRTNKWRNAITEQFDSAFAQNALKSLDKIVINVTSATSTDEALFLSSWIVDSLGIHVKVGGAKKIEGGHEIELESKTSTRPKLEITHVAGVGLHGISKISFHMKGEKGQSYSIESAYDSDKNSMDISTYGDHNFGNDAAHEACEFYVRRINCETISEGELIVKLVRRSLSPSHGGPSYRKTFLRLAEAIG